MRCKKDSLESEISLHLPVFPQISPSRTIFLFNSKARSALIFTGLAIVFLHLTLVTSLPLKCNSLHILFERG